MTVYALKARHEGKHPGSHFFDPDTLRFFGERLSDMRVLKQLETVTSAGGETHTCYCLSSLQRKAPGGPRRAYHYFDAETYAHIIR